MSVQKILLEQDTQGLKEALINKRLRRNRSKTLPPGESEEYHGRAVFWSPSKVKEACDWLKEDKESMHKKIAL
jgi:hypothetical protein